MAATAVTLNDLEGHTQVTGLFKCNPSNICAAFCKISTDSVLSRFLCMQSVFFVKVAFDFPFSHNRHRDSVLKLVLLLMAIVQLTLLSYFSHLTMTSCKETIIYRCGE